MSKWDLVEAELAQWSISHLPARLWLRDDDAIEPSGPLSQLVELTAQFDVPVTIAVIPNCALETLATYIANHPHVSVALHGYSHTNHAPASQKKCELGLHRDKQIVLAELTSGRNKLEHMFKEQFTNMLVPPWNRIDEKVVLDLPQTGLKSLSTFGWKNDFAAPHLAQLNTHVDIIDWKGHRGGRSMDELVNELVEQLKEARQRGGAPVGILSHHLVHDAAAWTFLSHLFAFCHQRQDISWGHATSFPGVSME